MQDACSRDFFPFSFFFLFFCSFFFLFFQPNQSIILSIPTIISCIQKKCMQLNNSLLRGEKEEAEK